MDNAIKSIHLFIYKVLLQVENHISHLIVVSNVVRTKNLHSLGIFHKRSGVLRSNRLFLLVAKRTHPTATPHHRVVKKELNESQQRYTQVEGKVELFV